MNTASRTRGQRGAGLVEILITTFVFSTGVLGVAGLQILSKKTNYDAIQHTQAGMLAFGIMERMRANPVCLSAYLTNNVQSDTAALAAPNCTTEACIGEPLARYDLIKWSGGLNGDAEQVDGASVGGISNPTGCITGPASGEGGLYTVAIAWRGVTPQALPSEFDADDPRSNACGTASVDYDDPDDAAVSDDRLRRILVLQSYVSNPGGSCGI